MATFAGLFLVMVQKKERMKFAIIAAGEGSRLAKEGVLSPKPLVEVAGKKLIDRLLGVFQSVGAAALWVVCNDLRPEVAEHLQQIMRHGLDGCQLPLHYIVRTTPSSMHSFAALAPHLEDGPFVLTTVDTIFRPEEFVRYVEDFSAAIAQGYDGLMGVTDFIDDERPLYVSVGDGDIITGFYDTYADGLSLISGGIYGLTPRALPVLHRCLEQGSSRMRNFQRAMVAEGLRLKAWRFSKVLDIDHATDIAKAEKFLEGCTPCE